MRLRSVHTLLSTASGLTRDDLAQLSRPERDLLYDWTREQSGGKNRTFIPASVRRMPIDSRMTLARSEDATSHWHERERRRVRTNDSGSFFYFVNQYGHVQPPKGKPQPFLTWPAQRVVAEAMVNESKLALPKARRMGISWLAMHYIDWLCEHNPLTDHARCLILSKGQDDAKEMLKRVKAVHENQPEWLRSVVTTDNTQEVYFGTASVKSLPATESAARSETATLVVLDEFAFVRNGAAAGINTAVEPTVEGAAGQGGQIIYVSSGNGEVGDGAEFASICRTAERGEGDVRMVFLPASARPDRDKETLEAKRAKDDRAVVEYAETLDEALAGDKTVNVYPKSHVAAAEYIGKRFESYAQHDALMEQGVEWGTDWGDFQTATLYAVGLPGAGLYVFDEVVQMHIEPQQASTNIIRHDPGGIRARDGGKLVAIASRQDASPAGTNATYASVLRNHRAMPEYAGRIPEQSVRIPFGEFKQGGKDRGKANTVGFLQWLFKRSQDFAEGDKPLDEAHGIIAIHPRCKLLLAQLRNLERDPSTGKVKKPALDPNHPEIGDHCPDALVALASAPRAVQWTKQTI